MLKGAGIQRQVGTRSLDVVWFVGGLLPMADWYGVPYRETRGVKVLPRWSCGCGCGREQTPAQNTTHPSFRRMQRSRQRSKDARSAAD